MNSKIETPNATMVPIGQIHPSPDNPRKFFDEAELKKLGETIKQSGLLEPLLLRPMPAPAKNGPGRPSTAYLNQFELVDGERRWRAAKLAGVDQVLAIVRPMTDAEADRARLLTFDQKVDISPIERAVAYQHLLDKGETIEALAKSLGKSPSTLRGLLPLTRCPPALAEAVKNGTVSGSTAALVCRVPSPFHRERAAQCVLEGIEGIRAAEFNDPKCKLQRSKFHSDGEGPLSYRATKELVRGQCMVELKGASFDRTSLTLLTPAGSCDKCPKRAGNDTDMVADGVRADVCTDPSCFRSKTEAAAKLAGHRVMTPAEVGKIFWAHGGLHYDAPWVDLDERCTLDKKQRTYKQLLGGQLKDQIVEAIDDKGMSRSLAPKKAAEEILEKEHGIKPFGSNGYHPPKPKTKAEQEAIDAKFERKQKIDEAVEREVLRKFGNIAVSCFEKTEANVASDKVLRALADILICRGDYSVLCELAGLKKSERSALVDHIEQSSGAELWRYVAWGMIDGAGEGDDRNGIAKAFNLPIEHIEQEARAAAEAKLDGRITPETLFADITPALHAPLTAAGILTVQDLLVHAGGSVPATSSQLVYTSFSKRQGDKEKGRQGAKPNLKVAASAARITEAGQKLAAHALGAQKLRRGISISSLALSDGMTAGLMALGIHTVGELADALAEARDVGLGKEQERIRGMIADLLAEDDVPAKKRRAS